MVPYNLRTLRAYLKTNPVVLVKNGADWRILNYIAPNSPSFVFGSTNIYFGYIEMEKKSLKFYGDGISFKDSEIRTREYRLFYLDTARMKIRLVLSNESDETSDTSLYFDPDHPLIPAEVWRGGAQNKIMPFIAKEMLANGVPLVTPEFSWKDSRYRLDCEATAFKFRKLVKRSIR